MPQLTGNWTEKLPVEELVEPVEVIVRKPSLLLNELSFSSALPPIAQGFTWEELPSVKEEPDHSKPTLIETSNWIQTTEFPELASNVQKFLLHPNYGINLHIKKNLNLLYDILFCTKCTALNM